MDGYKKELGQVAGEGVPLISPVMHSLNCWACLGHHYELAKTHRGQIWQKFSAEKGLMTYTAITDTLQVEQIATDCCDATKAKEEYGDGFDAAFTYRRGGELIVRSLDSAIAKHYCMLQQPE